MNQTMPNNAILYVFDTARARVPESKCPRHPSEADPRLDAFQLPLVPQVLYSASLYPVLS